MKTRSPIEMMVDKACGFDPNNPPPIDEKPQLDEIASTLLLIADAAKDWKLGKTGADGRLCAAVDKWIELGG